MHYRHRTRGGDDAAFFTNPPAYTVAVVTSDWTVEADYTNWRLRSMKGQERSSVNPDQVAAKLRIRGRLGRSVRKYGRGYEQWLLLRNRNGAERT